MARIRSIKPEFFTSLTIADLTELSARLTFIGLWTYVDDNGVGLDDARLIRAAIWPLEETPDILRRTREDLDSLQEAGLITRYEASGKHYLLVNTWEEHQKVSHPRKPRYPLPKQGSEQEVCTCSKNSGNPPEAVQSPPEGLRPEQGAGSREQGAGKGTPPAPAGPSVPDAPTFDDFWAKYPRNVGKADAEKAWTKAIKRGADPAVVVAAAVRHRDLHRRIRTENQFIPHASTWLNGSRYDDPPETAGSAAAGPQTAPESLTAEELQDALNFG